MTNECFAVSTRLILREQNFTVAIDSITLYLTSMTHELPLHSLPASTYTDGLTCISQTLATSKVISLSCLAQGFSSFSNESPVFQESFYKQSQANDDGCSPL